ncbi:hypothetical protein [Stackebrandtia nassauensis]|uniref:Membrane-associated oxidoreductase n=1 Tax=Stackebrandtia nassauensis (strain DSM 44728 / CIP 108903 / NRRL B-16338 / NBRC 102104 / LLR-40K-21) TaxID=446470 RepID=D3Q0R5_STANL|nr:hypothetical protein [Stackebrandtia nassauensis]ADD41801.1 hypothetical protein Snas_2107 [Stackebrandtia nassauensis DSM 44728]
MPEIELTETERRIAMAMNTGRLVDLRETDDPVRAAVLQKLLDEAGDVAVALRVRGARIVGHLNLGGRHIRIPVDLRECHFTGKILLAKSRLPELSLRGSHCPLGLSGRGLHIDGALNLADTRMDDTLYLKRLCAEIVFLDGAHLRSTNFALQLRGAEVKQELYCGRRFTAHGKVFMYGIKIGGQLDMNDAVLHNSGENCLVLNNSEVRQDVQLRNARIAGTTRFTKAKIGGNLELTSMAASAPGDSAVVADMIEVEQNVLLNKGFSAIGEVDFFLARVGGRLEVDGAWLSNPGGDAFSASRATIGQSLLLNDLATQGAIRLYGSKITGQLSVNGSTIISPDRIALDMGQCEIVQSLWICRGSRIEGTVDLTNARIGNRFSLRESTVACVIATDLSMDILDDDPECWPAGSHIGGMTYRNLPEDGRGYVHNRTDWLKRMVPQYTPQPYTQLISVYRSLGNNAAARVVVIEQEATHRRSHWNWAYRTVSRAWGGILRWTIGYGYAPWRVVPWMTGLFLAAWAVFSVKGAFSSAEVFSQSRKGGNHEEFHAALHALDTVLPVIALENDKQWIANGAFAWWEAGFASFGWFLSLLAAAGVAGVFKRQ